MPRHYRLDETDLRILKRLQMDARLSNVRLAAAVHLSPSACLERLRALEKHGIIARYVADFDLARFSGAITCSQSLAASARVASMMSGDRSANPGRFA